MISGGRGITSRGRRLFNKDCFRHGLILPHRLGTNKEGKQAEDQHGQCDRLRCGKQAEYGPGAFAPEHFRGKAQRAVHGQITQGHHAGTLMLLVDNHQNDENDEVTGGLIELGGVYRQGVQVVPSDKFLCQVIAVRAGPLGELHRPGIVIFCQRTPAAAVQKTSDAADSVGQRHERRDNVRSEDDRDFEQPQVNNGRHDTAKEAPEEHESARDDELQVPPVAGITVLDDPPEFGAQDTAQEDPDAPRRCRRVGFLQAPVQPDGADRADEKGQGHHYRVRMETQLAGTEKSWMHSDAFYWNLWGAVTSAS